jgi:hypothetical protein
MIPRGQRGLWCSPCPTSLVGSSAVNCGSCSDDTRTGGQASNCVSPAGQTDCSGTCVDKLTNNANYGCCSNAAAVRCARTAVMSAFEIAPEGAPAMHLYAGCRESREDRGRRGAEAHSR